jgi:hypothetical protein
MSSKVGGKGKRKRGASASAAPSAAAAACLADLYIRTFDFTDITKPPVIIIHAPREAGTTTLITSLLVDAQDRFGIDGTVVLCDRPAPDGQYMHGVVSKDAVFSKPADKVLKALIGIQTHRLGMEGGSGPLPRLALALDDTLYTPKLLKSEAFQCDVKRAKNYNIMVIIATSNCDTLPKSVNTFATHVIATRCISTEEPKHLHKRMFVMFPDAPSLVETLNLCRRYEFLVGLLCPCDASSNTIVDATRVYTPTLYVGNDDALHALHVKHSWAAAATAAGPSYHDSGDAAEDDDGAGSADSDFKTDPGAVIDDEGMALKSTSPARTPRVVTRHRTAPPVIRCMDANVDFTAHVSMVIGRL